MSRRDLILVAVIVVGVVLTGYFTYNWLSGPKHPDPPGVPKGLHVICANPECLHEEQHFDASITKTDWPTTCPKCGKQTLYMTRICPYCGKVTATPPPMSTQESIDCIHCGKKIMLVPPAPSQ